MNPENDRRLAVARNIQPIDTARLSDDTGNIYKAVFIVSKRANQIASAMKRELQEKLDEFSVSGDTLEEIQENREQIEIAKHYEQLPKPTRLALDEFLRGEVVFEDPTVDEDALPVL